MADSDQEDKPHRLAHWMKRIARWSALIGAVAGVVCHFMPHEYRALCRAVANLCT